MIPQYSNNLAQQWEGYERSLQMFMNNQENTTKIQYMINNEKRRFAVDIDKIRAHDQHLALAILKEPVKALKILKNSLVNVVNEYKGVQQDPSKKQTSVQDDEIDYHVTFDGNLGRNLITPRGLNSQMINQLVAVQGIVTRQSIVRQKLLRSVHYCPATQQGMVREYENEFDLTKEASLNALNNFPLKDQQNNPLQTELGYCKYVDVQTILLQEMPEKAPTGMIPRSVELVVVDDLVDKVKPGDRIQAIGVYQARNDLKTVQSGIFRCQMVCLNVNVLATELEAPTISAEDIKSIKEISENKNVINILSQSLAPSIYGHKEIKYSLLLMLLGGVEKTLQNSTHLRGDINIMVIGDPSTAKSQLLRRVLSIAPLAINTTGRGTSGVGLTAAVVFDKDSGDRYLAAGAMVLADKGIVCIDEFDKMSEEDRVAIHEVMEQQTVTIAKAGIHTSLNARCSVLAAANPVYGEYVKDLPPNKNIGLPDSLLSRFDLLFVVLDEKNADLDKLVAERVVKNHMYQDHGNKENHQSYLNYDDDYVLEPDYIDIQEDHQVWEKFHNLLQGEDQQVVTQNFLKKYIFYAKKQFQPSLTEEATNYISAIWSDLRQKVHQENSQNGPRVLPITIRSLETLIRLATAHAKLRLSKAITLQDAMFAERLLFFAIFTEKFNIDDLYQIDNKKNKRVTKSAKKTKPTIEQNLNSNADMEIEEQNIPQSNKQTRSSNKVEQIPLKVRSQSREIEQLLDNSMANQMPASEPQQQKFVYKILSEIVKKHKKDVVKFDLIRETIKQSNPGTPGYVNDQQMLRRVLQDMCANCKIELDDQDNIYVL